MKDDVTQLPYYTIDEVNCSAEGTIKEGDEHKSISRKSAENMFRRRSTWDWVKLLLKYLLVILIKFVIIKRLIKK